MLTAIEIKWSENKFDHYNNNDHMETDERTSDANPNEFKY